MGALAGALTIGVYLALMAAEGNNPVSQRVAWSLVMALACLLALAATLRSGHLMRWLLIAAMAIFLGLGVIGGASVGAGFMAAALLTGFAILRQSPTGAGQTPARIDRS